MLKIDFFPPDTISEYETKIAAKVKERNSDNDKIKYIPDTPGSSNEYEISIHDLLTLERKELFAISGIRLYMCICSLQKFKVKSNIELLCKLISEYPDKVHEIENRRGRYKYEINCTTYQTTCKYDTTPDDIITEAADLIKVKLSLYDADYANKYFKSTIDSIAELNKVIKKMFSDLEKSLCICKTNDKSTEKFIIDYSILPDDLRHKIMNSLGVRTCPYCNRNYITRYGTSAEKSTADLDHFYQKEQYPLFALSLFNFVPSCSVCNSRMKNVHPADDTLYPYEEGFEDDAHFELKPTGKNLSEISTLHLFQALKDTNCKEFNVEIVADSDTPSDKKERIEKSKELFHLTEVYANHKQDALEVALRTRVYCEGTYKKYCEKLLKKLEESGMKMSSSYDLEANMFSDIINDEWLMFGIFFNDEKRRFNKPLSKMIYDIYKSGKK